jgi:hypothetical protein
MRGVRMVPFFRPSKRGNGAPGGARALRYGALWRGGGPAARPRPIPGYPDQPLRGRAPPLTEGAAPPGAPLGQALRGLRKLDRDAHCRRTAPPMPGLPGIGPSRLSAPRATRDDARRRTRRVEYKGGSESGDKFFFGRRTGRADHQFVVPGRSRSERARNPCAAAPGLWIPGSRASPAPRNDGVKLRPHTSTFSAAINASCGMSTLPNCRMRFLPSFCLSSSFRLRVASPP